MNKNQFFEELRKKCNGIPKSELEKSFEFYEETIADRIEDGMTEDEAVAALGDIDEVAESILQNASLTALVKNKFEKSKHSINKSLWITLIIIGFPLWFSILLAGFSIVFSLYIAVWSIIISLYAIVFAFGLSGIASVIAGFIFMFVKTVPVGICSIGAGSLLVGLCGIMFILSKKITQSLIKFTKICMLSVKSLFIKSGGAN